MRLLSFFASILLTIFCATASAEWKPTGPVKVIMGLGPGASHDLVFRPLAKIVTEKTGVPFVVEYRVGQDTGVSLTTLAQQPRNGQTISINTVEAPYVNLPAMYPRSFNDSVKKPRMATLLGTAPSIFLVKNDSRLRTIDDFIRAYREEPINVATTGPGPVMLHNMMFLKTGSNKQLVAVNYKSAPNSFTDVLGGTLDVSIVTSLSGKSLVDSGQLRVIAATGDAPLPAPNLMDRMPGFTFKVAWALYLPPDTPDEIVNWFAKEFEDALRHPEIVAWWKERWGSVAEPGPMAAIRYATAAEQKWKPVAVKVLTPQE